ncbi:MAG TPA: sulfotransferase [Stellaceae bacterium]|nr:sulfotransferase [Stellaceae bacterium]
MKQGGVALIDTCDSLMELAGKLWERKALPEAERVVAQVLELAPDHLNARHLMGLIEHVKGAPERAAEHLARACADERAPAMFHRNLAEAWRQTGRLVEAETAARHAISLNPKLAEAWNTLGLVQRAADRPDDSRVCFETAILLDPQGVDAIGNLAAAHQAAGDLAAARHRYEEALAIDPRRAEIHGNLGFILGLLGEFDAAATHACAAIEIDPRLLKAYLIGAGVEMARRRYPTALVWMEGALSCAPDDPQVLASHANVLLALGQLDEALAVCEAVMAQHPDNRDAANILGLILREQGRIEDALTAFDHAEALDRGAVGGQVPDGSALNNKAVLLMELGRRSEALAAFDAAIAARPDVVRAWYNRTDLKKFAPGDPDIDAMERLLAKPGRSHSDRIHLHFALAKAYLDGEDADAGFAHLASGNQLKRATITYDAASTGRWIRSIAAACDKRLLDRPPPPATALQQPIFIIGMPRSGTTLIEQILASHPLVHGAGEPPYLRQLIRQGVLSDGENIGYPGFVTAASDKQLAAMGSAYFNRLSAAALDAVRIVDKTPSNFLYAGLIRLILPNARIIHCRRNPVDTCLSCYSKLFSAEQDFAYDQVELGRYYTDYAALTDHWRRVLPREFFGEIYYEDLVGDLEGTIGRLLDFCGLPWDPACLRFHETDRGVRTASVNQVRLPLYNTSVARWTRYRTHLQPLLDALGDITTS